MLPPLVIPVPQITETLEGLLHAYDALNIQNELWNSQMNNVTDNIGFYPKFQSPTIVNGKV